jgi:hypothetical protein
MRHHTRAGPLKLDGITKSIADAQNEMIDIEHLSGAELQKLPYKVSGGLSQLNFCRTMASATS